MAENALAKQWCAPIAYVVTITNGVNFSFMISFKIGFHISGPSMFSACSNYYK